MNETLSSISNRKIHIKKYSVGNTGWIVLGKKNSVKMVVLDSGWKGGRGTSVLMASEFEHCCHILSYSVSLCCFVYIYVFSRDNVTDLPAELKNFSRRWDWTDLEVGPYTRIFFFFNRKKKNSLHCICIHTLYKESDLGFLVVFVWLCAYYVNFVWQPANFKFHRNW